MDIYSAVDKLNEFTKLDPSAMESLVIARVVCNQDIADHPTLQVSVVKESFVLGLLGVLNGLFSVEGKYVCVTWDGEPKQIRFSVMELEVEKSV